jgi:hypothetical protein
MKSRQEQTPITETHVAPTTSTPMELPREQQALFREVLTHLEQSHVSYAVAGAFALRHHTGIARFTKDLDIFLTASSASSLLAWLQERGFECEVCDTVWLAKVHKDDYFVDLITGMSNAAITVDESWISRAIPARVCDVDSRVLGAEELLVSKLFVSRRERFDGADIAHIIFGSRGQLEWDRVFALAGEHWELVLWSLLLFAYVYPAHKEFVPKRVWDDLLQRFSASLQNPSKNARFRGSLVDDVMFAIDVQEWGMDNMLAEFRERGPKIQFTASSRAAGR